MRVSIIKIALLALVLAGCALTGSTHLRWRQTEPSENPWESRVESKLECTLESKSIDERGIAKFRYAVVFERYGWLFVVIDSAVAYVTDTTGVGHVRFAKVADLVLEQGNAAYSGKWTCEATLSELERMRWFVFVGVMPIPGNRIFEYTQSFDYPSR